MRIKKSTQVKKSTPRSKKSTHLTGAIGAQAIFLVVIGVVAAAAMLIGARQSSPRSSVAAGGTQQEKLAAAQARATRAAASEAPAGAVLDTTLAANATTSDMPAMESAPKGPAQKAGPVTITGCLELANETFRLKDTTGVDVPKARSWKSGFLKKGSASIEVVDAANRVRLPNHVGQRVSVTGMLVDREMQVRSLKRIAASCNVQVAKL